MAETKDTTDAAGLETAVTATAPETTDVSEPDAGMAGEEVPEAVVLKTIADVNAATAALVIAAIFTVEELDQLDAIERANPHHEGGRVSVMRAIAARRQVITATPAPVDGASGQ